MAGRDVAKLLWIPSALFLAFLAGMADSHYRLWPSGTLQSVVRSGRELATDWRGYLGFRPSRLLLHPARSSGTGVTNYRAGQADNGLTLISGLFDNQIGIVLIDMHGTVVNRWSPRYNAIFPSPDHVIPRKDRPNSRWGYAIHDANAFEDGSVVFNFEYLGMVKMDRCGNVVWTVPQMTHHLFSQSEDGTFWVLSRRYRDTDSGDHEAVRTPFFDDTILQVTPDGRVVREIEFLDVIAKGGLQALLADPGLFSPIEGGAFTSLDPVHLNDVEVFSVENAIPALGIRPGDLLVSSRQLNLLIVFDPSTLETRWWQSGPWLRQHDPDILPGGRLSLFNNNTGLGPSTIMAVDLLTRRTNVLYPPEDGAPFFSAAMGAHQHLPNGNLLITDPQAGRVFEVTPAAETVWEYINRYDPNTVADVSVATRYPSGFFKVTGWSCSS